MPKTRRKISAVKSDFLKEISKLESFDDENQSRFSSSSNSALTRQQLHLLSETTFFYGFRNYENFIREVFILYCMEKPNEDGKKPTSYLNPKDFLHTEKLIRSSMAFLDWNSPSKIIERSELYLKDGFPIKLPYINLREALSDYRDIRNHIAHNSSESLEKYKRVLRKHYGVTPLKIPTPGEYLLMSKKKSKTYILKEFFSNLKNICEDIT